MMLGSGRDANGPISRLPAEVVVEIFLLCIPKDFACHVCRDEYTNPLVDFACQVCHDEYTNPLVLSSVCRRWRQIAVDCSALWRNIDVAFPARARLHLTRAKDADLNVYFNVYKDAQYQGSRRNVDHYWVWKYGKRIAMLYLVDIDSFRYPEMFVREIVIMPRLRILVLECV